jgi:DNA modification methylase
VEIKNQIFTGDCKEVMREFPINSISACITDPPYNYEFIGHKWDAGEIEWKASFVPTRLDWPTDASKTMNS